MVAQNPGRVLPGTMTVVLDTRFLAGGSVTSQVFRMKALLDVPQYVGKAFLAVNTANGHSNT